MFRCIRFSKVRVDKSKLEREHFSPNIVHTIETIEK